MTQSSTLHRHLCLIRQVQPPLVYPSKESLIARLIEQGFAATSQRTLERDMKTIEDEYGLPISYSRIKGGYFLHLPTHEDISDFQEFTRLLERRERLEFLTQSVGSAHDVSRYLQLERNEFFRGAEYLPTLWEALRSGRVLGFTYTSYAQSAAHQRKVEPGLIFEYRNRWYLAGWDLDANQMRTFGLDRMGDPQLTNQAVLLQRQVDYRTFRQLAIGVTSPPDALVEHVILRFTAQEGQYVKSLPLHNTQHILYEDTEVLDIELHVILNHELEREILAYGEEVEVIAPLTLREKLANRLSKAFQRYSMKS